MASTGLKIAFWFTLGVATLAGVLSKVPPPNRAAAAPQQAPVARQEVKAPPPPVVKPEPPEVAEPDINDTPAVSQIAAVSMLSGGSGNGVAALININGHLCGEVVEAHARRGSTTVFDVTCVEYRGGSTTVRYRVNGKTGDVSRS